MRKRFVNAFVVVWASLECTNHSKAKGGVSRDADSRTLAEHLIRYIKAIDPDFSTNRKCDGIYGLGSADCENKTRFRNWV